MTNEELLIECKRGLGYQEDDTNLDTTLMPKILMVKAYMLGAGVSDSLMESDLAVGVIVMGVSDLWDVKAGNIKFSQAFNTLLSQLAI